MRAFTHQTRAHTSLQPTLTRRCLCPEGSSFELTYSAGDENNGFCAGLGYFAGVMRDSALVSRCLHRAVAPKPGSKPFSYTAARVRVAGARIVEIRGGRVPGAQNLW
jgi:hypothetical protein